MSISKFYDLEALKIMADGEKIELFTRHPGTLGAFREARIRQYVVAHVPGLFTVSSGFITAHDPDGEDIYDRSSKQIDCLIYDAAAFSPLLQAEDFAIVNPDAVCAIIEIKSDPTLFKSRSKSGDQTLPFRDANGPFEWGGTLVDALKNIKSAIDVLDIAGIPRGNYFAGVMSTAEQNQASGAQ